MGVRRVGCGDRRVGCGGQEGASQMSYSSAIVCSGCDPVCPLC